jgi:hypothetical protein
MGCAMGFSNALKTGIFKRKFRWTLSITACGTDLMTDEVCKTGNRPNIDIDEQQIDYLNARMWIPGKATLETLEFTFFDVSGPVVGNLISWLKGVYNFSDEVNLCMSSKMTGGYAGTGTLILYDGCGTAMELWRLIDCWPKTLNFGDLDMSSAEECTISLTMRYRNLDYQGFCGSNEFDCGCQGC